MRAVRYYNCTELHGDDSLPPAPQRGATILFVHFGHRHQQRLSQVRARKRTPCTSSRKRYKRRSHREAPVGLPVRMIGGLRDGLRDFLADRSVFCPARGKLPHVRNATQTAADHRLDSEIMTLPIDQRMDQHQVRRFAMLLQQFFADRS
jgi:hypothetical protein